MRLSLSQAVALTASSALSLLLLRPPAQGIHILHLFDAPETPGDPFLASTLQGEESGDYYDGSISNLTTYQHLHEYKKANETASGDHTPTKATDTASWTTLMEERFAARLSRLKATCRSHGTSLVYSVHRTLTRNLFYSKNYKLMVCAVAKAGSTTWKSHLFVMGGRTILPENVHVIYGLRASEQFGLEGTQAAMQSDATTTIMTVRHPLDRLVSAYRDKFYDGGPMSSSDSYSQKALKHLARQGERGMVSFTFTEFLTHIVKDQEEKLPNVHWRNYYKICSPCTLHYDFIMNMETFSEDLKYIIKKLGAKEVRVDWRLHAHPHNTSSVHYEHYYTNITHSLIKRVYEKYKIDFQMFGYEIPGFLKGILS